MKTVNQLALEVIDGNWGSGEARKKKLTEAGYDYEAVQKRVNEILEVISNMNSWAKKIADSLYHYVTWKSSVNATHTCPICTGRKFDNYFGWNCIGFSFACWRHGAGIRSRCSCEVIDNGSWERLLNCQTDAEADRLASRMVGVPCMVIRNGGNAIPLSMLKKGDIISLFNGSTYFHTMFYEGKGKYADSTCGRSDEIQSGLTMSDGTKSQVKVAIRYIG